MDQESNHSGAPPAGAEPASVEGTVQREVHLEGTPQDQQHQHQHQQLVAAHQQLMHQQETTPTPVMDTSALHDQTQQLPVTMADSATVAAAIAAGLMGSGMGMAQLLASTPITAAHAGALGMLGQAHGGDGLGDMSGGPTRSGPASIPRGQEGYSRKAKSLSLLCENFVAQFGQVVNQVINLDNAASQLGVERRRIYDIVNVLESIKVVSKLQKNQYQWHGTAKLMDTLTELHEEAQREMEEAKTLSGEDLASLGLDDRKEKSMSRLSQRFVQMFMLSKTRSLGLDEAARALLGGNEDQGQYKTKVRRLYDIANILSALKIIEKTHVGDKGKPGFRWLGPEGLQSIRPMSTTTHIAAPAAAAFHLQPGGFQAALAGDLPPLNMASTMGTAGGMQEGATPGGQDAAAGGQVSLPAPASLYVGGDTAAMSMPAAPATAGGSGGSGGNNKRPRRKSLRAREAEAESDEEYEDVDEEYEEGGTIKRRPSEEPSQKRLKVEQPADQATQQVAVAVQQHAVAPPPAGMAMFSELPLVMPTAGDAAAAAAVAAAMASGAYGAVDMAAHAAQQANKPKVHPLLKFMELESQTEQGPGGMRRMMGADLVRADGHLEGQVTEGAQAATWPAAAWGGMGMEWLTNPAMAASMYGGFWPASAYAANMATARPAAKPAGVTAEGQPAAAAGEGGEEAAPGTEHAPAAAGVEQAVQDASGTATLPQVTFPYGLPTAAAPAAGAAVKPEGTTAGAPTEGQVVLGEAEAAAAAAPTSGADVGSGQPLLDAQAAAQAAAAAGNPLAWQYWQYMYTNLYANAANAAQAANPSVYTNMYANWTKKHDGTTAEGAVAEAAAPQMEGAPAPATDAGAAHGDATALPVGAYPVVTGDMVGYDAVSEAQHAEQAHHMQQATADQLTQQQQPQDHSLMGVGPDQQGVHLEEPTHQVMQ